jgi:hypothetical protein
MPPKQLKQVIADSTVVFKKEGIPKAVKQRKVLREVSSNKRVKRVKSGCKKSIRFGYNVRNTPLYKDSTC